MGVSSVRGVNSSIAQVPERSRIAVCNGGYWPAGLTEPDLPASNDLQRKGWHGPGFYSLRCTGLWCEVVGREVVMYKFVGFGLIALLVGYVGWLAFGGSTFAPDETVVIGGSGGGTSGLSGSEPHELQIVTLLGFDAIPSIENPRFVDAEKADDTYGPTELILGVDIEGDVRAYSVPLLSRHEIVNDVVGGKPIAVTW